MNKIDIRTPQRDGEPTTIHDIETMMDTLSGLGDAVHSIGEIVKKDDMVHGDGLMALGELIRIYSEGTLKAAWPLMGGKD